MIGHRELAQSEYDEDDMRARRLDGDAAGLLIERGGQPRDLSLLAEPDPDTTRCVKAYTACIGGGYVWMKKGS